MMTEAAVFWQSLLGPTWVTVGNAWRNLFLLSFALQALALGTAFALHGWWSSKSRAACFLTGAAATPLAQYLWTLLLAVVWPQAPKLVYIGMLPALAALSLPLTLLRHRQELTSVLRKGFAFCKRVFTFDKPALISLCFALAMLLLLLPACVRLANSANAANPADSGEYMGLALRYTQDRNLGALLEKEETVGHFRGHSHFPSLELYMVQGLMHAGESMGYPYDKPMLFGLGLLSFCMAAAYLALLLVLCRQQKRWVLLGALLLNLVPNLYHSVAGAPRDIWRILALFLAALYFAGLNPRGSWKSYLGKLALTAALCFTVMSAHVVCFVVLPFIVAAWVLGRWYASALMEKGRSLRTLLAGVGVALAGAAGTLAGFAGNLWCYFRWGEMSPWRLMTTYTNAPWYNAYMTGEYKQEITSRHLDFWHARYDIVMAYATPVGLWGMRLALVGLSCAIAYLLWKRFSTQRTLGAEGGLLSTATQNGQHNAATLAFAALLTLCTLAPMTGLLDSSLYSFSGSFLTMDRYTLQWFMWAAAMIPTLLAAATTAWPSIRQWLKKKLGKRARWADMAPMRSLPALLCAVLCVVAFWQGTRQTGYANGFYRLSRHVMESPSQSLDNGFLERYGLLMVAARHVPEDQRIIITREGYQYPLRARGYILTSNPIVPLMNLPADQIAAALAEQKVAMIATEPAFWDNRYYALSTLSAVLNALPPEQILQDGQMRLYVLDPTLSAAIAAELNAAGGIPPIDAPVGA